MSRFLPPIKRGKKALCGSCLSRHSRPIVRFAPAHPCPMPSTFPVPALSSPQPPPVRLRARRGLARSPSSCLNAFLTAFEGTVGRPGAWALRSADPTRFHLGFQRRGVERLDDVFSTPASWAAMTFSVLDSAGNHDEGSFLEIPGWARTSRSSHIRSSFLFLG